MGPQRALGQLHCALFSRSLDEKYTPTWMQEMMHDGRCLGYVIRDQFVLPWFESMLHMFD